MKNIISYDSLVKYFINSIDVKIAKIIIDNYELNCIYVNNLANTDEFNSHFTPIFNKNNINNLDNLFPGICKKIDITDFLTIEEQIFNGKILILSDNINYEFNIIKKPLRMPTSSNIDPINLLGANDDFIEDASVNLALIRKRLKTTDLIIEEITLGDKNKTTLYLTYLKEFNTYRDEIVNKLTNNNNKFPSSVESINKLFQGNSLMPMTINTGSPENFALALTQGRTGIIIDNSPIGIIVPVTLSSFANMKNDENSPFFFSIPLRFFLLIFLIFSIFGLGFALAIINYHPDSLTISIISNLKLSERGTNFTIFIEIICILILFEFYRYAASRSPLSYVQNIVIILGGLFIGQNAINSGLIGPLILLVTAASYLSSFAFTNNPHMVTAISNFRFFVLIFSHFLGMIGFFLSSFLVIAYLSSLSSFDIPYLYPFSPTSKKSIKEYFIPRSKRWKNF